MRKKFNNIQTRPLNREHSKKVSHIWSNYVSKWQT